MASRPEFECSEHGRVTLPHPPSSSITCVGCWAAWGRWRAVRDGASKLRKRGKARGGGQSSNRKGLNGAKQVRELLLKLAGSQLERSDVVVTRAGENGEDLVLSARARKVFNLCIESKNKEKLAIWQALREVEERSSADCDKPLPILFFTRAYTPLYVALSADSFLRVWMAARGLQASSGEEQIAGRGGPQPPPNS